MFMKGDLKWFNGAFNSCSLVLEKPIYDTGLIRDASDSHLQALLKSYPNEW